MFCIINNYWCQSIKQYFEWFNWNCKSPSLLLDHFLKMKQITSPLICTLLYICCINLLPVSQGLDCFKCIYAKSVPGGIEPIPGYGLTDKCKKKPKSNLKGTCTPASYPVFPFPLLPQKVNISQSEEEEEVPTCAKVHAKIADAEIIFRGCFSKSMIETVDRTKLGTCTSGNLKTLADQYPEIELGIDGSMVNVDICFCDGDGCNSANSLMGSGLLWISVILTSIIFSGKF